VRATCRRSRWPATAYKSTRKTAVSRLRLARAVQDLRDVLRHAVQRVRAHVEIREAARDGDDRVQRHADRRRNRLHAVPRQLALRFLHPY
jgi:hypothetical protein